MSIKTDIGRIKSAIRDSSAVLASLEPLAGELGVICGQIIDALKSGRKILTAGNGGSACEALHMSEELIGRFKTDRRPLPSVSLCADPTVLTCIGNDFGFDSIFSRQIEGLGEKDDILVLFSSSGNSVNLINCFEPAKRKGVKTISIIGKGGGKMKGRGDHELIVNSSATERVQEAHQLIMHIILDAIEEAFK